MKKTDKAGKMGQIVLCRGDAWLFPSSGYIIEKFHQIALEQGSRARWMPVTGMLVTDDPEEPGRHHPYDDWREVALKVLMEG